MSLPLAPGVASPEIPLPAPARPRSAALPLLAGALAAACFVSMDTAIKLISERYDALQLSFFRFGSGSVFAVALWLRFRTALPSGRAWRLHIARSGFLLLSLVSYFYALTALPLAQTVAISYLAPIFVSILAIPLLREKPSPWIWLALSFGLGGVSVSMVPELLASLRGGGAGRLLGMASAALSAMAFAAVMLLARHQAQRDSLWTILLVQNVLPLLLLSVPAMATWRPLHLPDLLPIGLVGVLATVGLLALTYAFTKLEASRIAPLEYTSFVWATALGYVVLGEVPSATTGASAVLIIAGCLLLLRR